MNDQELQDLIRLKRYEQPEEGYYESFLEEFHERRSKELLTGSARTLLMERVSVWFSQLGAIKWVGGAGLAYAAVTLCIMVTEKEASDSQSLATAELPTAAVNKVVEKAPENETVVPVSVAHSTPISFNRGAQPLAVDTNQLF